MIKYLLGYVRIKVEGYSPERLLNLCNIHKILLWNVEHKDASYVLCLGCKDFKRLRPLVKKTRTKVQILGKYGVPFFLHKFRKRKAFFLGMFMCAGMICVCSLFVWNIHLEGNVSQSTTELLNYLESIGVSHGCRKSKIICEEIETKFRSKYPNMLWVSAEMRGTRVIIQIKENTDDDIISKIEEKEVQAVSLVAEQDGIIDSIIVRNGTPLVKKGDEVTKGQILVEGYYPIKNDAGEIVRYEGVAADADIQIAAIDNYQDSFPAAFEEKKYTERKRLGFRVLMKEKCYDFVPRIPFLKYEKVDKLYNIKITENYFLPFSIEFHWYLEYVPQMVKYNDNELNHLAKKRFYEKYENILQKGVQIIEKDVRIDTNGKLCHAIGTVHLLVPVNKKVPAEIPKLINNASLEGEN